MIKSSFNGRGRRQATRGFWIYVVASFWLVVFGACAESHELPDHPSRNDVVEAALVGWSYAGFTDPRDVDYNRVATIEIRRAEDFAQYADLCSRDIPLVHKVTIVEDRFCYYWVDADGLQGSRAAFPVVLLRHDVPDSDWAEVGLHGVLHYFAYVILNGSTDDGDHAFSSIWGADGAEEVARWEL